MAWSPRSGVDQRRTLCARPPIIYVLSGELGGYVNTGLRPPSPASYLFFRRTFVLLHRLDEVKIHASSPSLLVFHSPVSDSTFLPVSLLRPLCTRHELTTPMNTPTARYPSALIACWTCCCARDWPSRRIHNPYVTLPSPSTRFRAPNHYHHSQMNAVHST